MTYQNLSVRARANLDRRLAPLRNASDFTRPPRGWIRAIREAIGMTTAQLAQRIGVSQPRIPQLEKAEVEGAVTLKTLRQAAEAMNCTLVYALVPNEPLSEMVRERATRIANERLARTNHTMTLENQGLTPSDLKAEQERLIAGLIAGDPRRLWDKP
jgi:predicted DNA-binding mobile mystery protein A